ncbi:TrmH family RNA methyltransferase [Alkaliphilus hydrothermalis]|uniref:TrmH family RNA methyltransferase n=1 Tax=Alkaliphilus hydrothermalis TaxID=1482730 RepID=A0ABS2NSJ7_9FIRM|nr:RNA methyltransferase [Alkaliphilus hydrothermalis]MBM7615930.1 TrmH family RNA methyltransferase [Alkaliphilus hydrothermalis]
MEITSESNPTIKFVKGLQIKKNRMKYKQFVIEGLRFLQEALEHGVALEYILYSDSAKKIKGGDELIQQIEGKYQMYHLPDKLMEKLSETENPQGIMAVINMPEYSLDSLSEEKELFLVVLDRIQDPGNMGTIIRTAEGAGANAVLITKGSVDPYNSKTLRATMGAVFHFPVVQVEEDEELIEFLKKNKVRMVATHLDTENTYDMIDYKGSIALIIGNEANGIQEGFVAQAEEMIKIPIVGKIESLNASVAAGVLIYKAFENRRK